MSETSVVTMVVFTAYILGVFGVAACSHRLLRSKSFLSEYFLGSRGLGTWAFAFTFAATSASGGSFGGYPSLIYSYGWVLALWIASYMIFPLTTMGVIGKRINQVARKTDAITVPDVLRDRFESPAIGISASLIIIVFTTCVLVAQFKLGALIIEDTFNLTFKHSYEVSLLIFAVTVVFYTAYGGFRAVVWTDVMQGIVMGLGVVILLPIVLIKLGGLQQAAERLLTAPAVVITSVPGPPDEHGIPDDARDVNNDLLFRAMGKTKPTALVYEHPRQPNSRLEITWNRADSSDGEVVIRLATDADGQLLTTGNDVLEAISEHPELGTILRGEIPYRNEEFVSQDGTRVSLGATGVIGFPAGKTRQRFVFREGAEFLFGPARTNTGQPFHPLGMVISFFFMWAIIGIGQPGMMVRLMAFRDSKTLKRSILTVTIYYALIYVPLVFIVMAAREHLPALTPKDSDRTMGLIATRLVADMGPFYKVLGAIFVAAPFAAVMSTVDSFLLMISSGAVRDIYQRSINPHVSERTVRRASYATTVVVGALVTFLALHPPDFLQKIIVFVSGGFAAVFLCPILLGLYWRGMTRQGALAAMLSGFVVTVVMFLPPSIESGRLTVGGSRIDLMGFHPSMWAMLVSFVMGILVSRVTGPPPQHIVERYFMTREDGQDE